MTLVRLILYLTEHILMLLNYVMLIYIFSLKCALEQFRGLEKSQIIENIGKSKKSKTI